MPQPGQLIADSVQGRVRAEIAKAAAAGVRFDAAACARSFGVPKKAVDDTIYELRRRRKRCGSRLSEANFLAAKDAAAAILARGETLCRWSLAREAGLTMNVAASALARLRREGLVPKADPGFGRAKRGVWEGPLVLSPDEMQAAKDAVRAADPMFHQESMFPARRPTDLFLQEWKAGTLPDFMRDQDSADEVEP